MNHMQQPTMGACMQAIFHPLDHLYIATPPFVHVTCHALAIASIGSS